MKAIIEMPKGTKDKAEADKVTGELKIDRKLDIQCPFNYGYIDNTLAEDGDPLDIFVLGPELPGLTTVEVVPVGVFFCEDQGIPDHKILATTWELGEIDASQAIKDITYYLNNYKKGFRILEYSGNTLLTLRVIRSCRLHRVKPKFRHETLGWKKLVSLLALAAFLALINKFFGRG